MGWTSSFLEILTETSLADAPDMRYNTYERGSGNTERPILQL